LTITPQNLLRHELIGMKTTIILSSDPTLVNLKGVIVDETKKMLILETPEGRKKIPKQVAHLGFTLPGGRRVNVDGKLLVGRPEERIKHRWRCW